MIEPRPRALVDQEVVELGLALGRPIRGQVRQQAWVAGPDLLEEEAVHEHRGLDELRERLPLRSGEVRSTDGASSTGAKRRILASSAVVAGAGAAGAGDGGGGLQAAMITTEYDKQMTSAVVGSCMCPILHGFAMRCRRARTF